jgi:hypothetical protein
MQWFYDQLQKDVKTVLRGNSPTIAREQWHNFILSALEMIGHGDDSMDDATVDDAMDDATGDDATDKVVDDVLDKILDNAIEAYGLSARDVYEAIPFFGSHRKSHQWGVVRPEVRCPLQYCRAY